MQNAFSGPLVLRGRLGALDAGAIAAAHLEPIFREKPALHRYPARGRDASTIWRCTSRSVTGEMQPGCGPTPRTPTRCNISALPGLGDMKVTSLGSVFAKRLKVKAAEGPLPGHPTLGDVRSAQALAGCQAAKREHKAAMAKARPPR